MGTGRQGEFLIPRPGSGMVPHFSSPCPPGRQLNYTFPLVYDYKLEGDIAQRLPDLVKVAKGLHVRSKPWNSSVTLTSKAGATFQSFVKSRNFGDGEPCG